jgi:exodeoxyribonuclease VII small subunit
MSEPRVDPDADLSFEQRLDELETLVGQLESGDLSLDQMLERYEHGMALVASCQRQLAEAELRVTRIAADTGEIDCPASR